MADDVQGGAAAVSAGPESTPVTGIAPPPQAGPPLELSFATPCTVTIAFMDGQRRVLQLSRFSAALADIVAEAEPSAGATVEKRRPLMLRAEDIAYIGFQRAAGVEIERPDDLEQYKIHIAGGEQVAVVTGRSATHSVGFVGYPVDDSSPFASYFFYQHGVNRREKDAPIGSLLVSSGVLGRDALSHGVEAQRITRGVPIGQILVEQKKLDEETIDEAVDLQKRRRLRLGEVLQEAGLVSAEDIDQALAEQKKRRGKRLGEVLIDLGLLRERDLAITLAHKFDLPFVNLDEVAINPEAAEAVGRDVLKKYEVVALDLDTKVLTIAISDPTSIEVIDVLRVKLGRRIREVVVVPSQLRQHVEQQDVLFSAPAGPTGPSLDDIMAGLAATDATVEADEDEAVVSVKETEGGIIQLVNRIIVDAFHRGASDIHIEPNGKAHPVTVRFRIDGGCVAYQELPPIVRNALVSCIKIMSKLDISERRKPQDGKIRMRLPDRQIELRVATIPSVNGNEDVVMRILAASKPLPLASMGLQPNNLSGLQQILDQPYGLILCVGPTGSGKTTTLHSALGYLNTVDTKIWTAEDPVEITQAGLRQVQVSSKIGFTFAAAMRAFLRADPDVIMVGEMRDTETASIGVEASLTGHLVLSTLHTNSAPETVTRLLDMGIDPLTFSDALLGILAQRLARTLCPSCGVHEAATEAERHELVEAYGPELFAADFGAPDGKPLRIGKTRGCDECNDTGYKGRLGVHELLVTNAAIKAAISSKAPIDTLRRLAIDSGMRTLLQDGMRKVMAGRTDMRAIFSVCSRG